MASPRRGRIVFLQVPETLRGKVQEQEEESGGFSIDPAVPIPVEIPEGEEQLNLNELSWEMILSGMLRVIADGAEEDARLDYYRAFVLVLRPGIMGEFTEAAILKARNGDFDLALEILAALRGLFPGSPVPLLNSALALEERASLLERQGREEAAAAYLEAAAAYEEILESEPPFPQAHFNGGFFFLKQKDYSRARECFSRYIEIAEDEDKKEQAASIIKEIEDGGLEDENFREALAWIKKGEEEKALKAIRDFLEERPRVWNGWFILGWALRRLKRWEDGAAAFQQAIALGGGGDEIHNELAICLMETGDFASARTELEKALREDPENIKIISNLGVLAMKSGSSEEAAAFFRTVLDLDPGDPVAQSFLGQR